LPSKYFKLGTRGTAPHQISFHSFTVKIEKHLDGTVG
jgi:hypothetical protein